MVLNYNSGDYLPRCIAALFRQDCDGFSVVIGDNGSDDGSFLAAKDVSASLSNRLGTKLRFVQLGDNTGFARGNNLLVQRVETPFVALLNPDTEPEPAWLRSLLEATKRHPDVRMFGSTQVSLRDEDMLDGAGDSYLACGIPWRGGYGHSVRLIPTEGEVFSPCAAAALYCTETFRSVGGFDESYFCYVEDVDLGFRLRLRGEHCVQLPEAIVRHAGGGSSEGDGSFARYHGTRNMIWTFVKNMPGPLFWLLLPVHISALMILLVKAISRGNSGPVFRGICDAATGLPQIWRKRRAVQQQRTASTCDIARSLCWNPITYLRRLPVMFRR